MGAPDISRWLWPDAAQGRAPTGSIRPDRSNPLLAGLADIIVPSDPSTYTAAYGTATTKLDPSGAAFNGLMRLQGRKGAVVTDNGYTILVLLRVPNPAPGGLVVAASIDDKTGGSTPWIGCNGGNVAVSNSAVDYGPVAVANGLYAALGVYAAFGFTSYVNGDQYSSNSFTVGGTATLCLMNYANSTGFGFTGNVLAAIAWNRPLTTAEARAVTASPEAVFSLLGPAPFGLPVTAPLAPRVSSGTLTATRGTASGTSQAHSSAHGALAASAATAQGNSAARAHSVGSLHAASQSAYGNSAARSHSAGSLHVAPQVAHGVAAARARSSASAAARRATASGTASAGSASQGQPIARRGTSQGSAAAHSTSSAVLVARASISRGRSRSGAAAPDEPVNDPNRVAFPARKSAGNFRPRNSRARFQ
jgi:hypothetical protein